MKDDDKALVERLRTNQCADNMGCNPLAPYCQCAFMDDAADRIEALTAENERLIKAGDGDVGLIHWQGERIEQLEAALTKSEALQDLAYYNGAKQYAAISAQSEDAARDWLNGGCGNRQRDAIAALGDAK